jgi:hypothetical protein
MEVIIGIGLIEKSELNIHIPFFAYRNIGPDFPGFSSNGMGDLAVDMKYSFFEGSKDAVGLGVVSFITLPTGSADNLTGAGAVTYGAVLVADKKIGPVMFALNFGYHQKPTVSLEKAIGYKEALNTEEQQNSSEEASSSVESNEVGASWIIGAGFEWRIFPKHLSFIGEYRYTPSLKFESNVSPMELLGGFNFRVDEFNFMVGGAHGLNDNVGGA